MLEEVKDKCENFDMLLEILKMKSTIAKIKNSVDDLNIWKVVKRQNEISRLLKRETKDGKYREESKRHMDMVDTCN